MSIKSILILVSIFLLLLSWWFTTLCVIACWAAYGCMKLLICASEANVL